MLAPTASSLWGQVAAPSGVSVTAMFFRASLPVLVTTYVQVIASPVLRMTAVAAVSASTPLVAF